jgi:Protein of unknown function (DUF2933)
MTSLIVAACVLACPVVMVVMMVMMRGHRGRGRDDPR